MILQLVLHNNHNIFMALQSSCGCNILHEVVERRSPACSSTCNDHAQHRAAAAQNPQARRTGAGVVLTYAHNAWECTQTAVARKHPLPLGLQMTYATGVHTLLHLRADAGTPTPAAVHRGEVGSTRWAALAHYVRRSWEPDAR